MAKNAKILILTAVVTFGILVVGNSVLAQPGAGAITIPNPLDCPDIGCVLQRIASFLFMIATPILTIMVLWAGFLFMTSAGNDQKIADARKVLFGAVIGFAIVLINWGFASIVSEILGAGGRRNGADGQQDREPVREERVIQQDRRVPWEEGRIRW